MKWPTGKDLVHITDYDGYPVYVIYNPEDYVKKPPKLVTEREFPPDWELVAFDEGSFWGVPKEVFNEVYDNELEDESSPDQDVDDFENQMADLSESCEICGKLPRLCEMEQCDNGHTFDATCWQRWHNMCPHCEWENILLHFGTSQKCPNELCNLAPIADLRSHLIEKHSPRRCNLCKRRFLLDGTAMHNSLVCGLFETTCPAEHCREDISYAHAYLGKVDPTKLEEFHGCKGVVQCLVCGRSFLSANKLLDHSENEKCADKCATTYCRRRVRRATIKGMERIEDILREESL